MLFSEHLINKTWNKEKYNKYIEYLKSLQDKEYKEFHSSLILNSQYEIIGVRVPMMREIAKIISKNNNIENFLKNVQNKYYEEVMIEGLIISHIKNEETFYKYFKEYIKKIDNWALCDSFCNSIKIVRQNEEKYFNEAIKLSLNKNEFISRVGLVIIIFHFVNANNLNSIFNTLNKIQTEKFYINMAEAWLICEMYIKYPEKTEKFLQDNKLNRFTQNKAISKIHDSYRVSKEKKNLKYLHK